MPDDVKPAESSPATPPAPEKTQTATPAEPSYRQRLDGLTRDERKEWQRTGKLPEPKKSETAVPATKPAAKVETAAESEPANDDNDGNGSTENLTPEQRSERDKRNNARRWNKTQRELGAKDARIAELERQIAATGKAESAPAKEPAKPSEGKSRPKLADFTAKIGKDFANYDEAVEAHIEAVSDWKIEDRERIKRENADRKRAEESDTQVRTQFQERSEAMREKHEDFDEVAFSAKLPLNETQIQFVLGREHGMDVLYALGKNLNEAARISKLDPFETAAEMHALEKTLTAAPPPVKTSTDAPPPPQNVGGRATAVDDPLDVALKKKDWAAVNRLRNQRDLEKRGVSVRK